MSVVVGRMKLQTEPDQAGWLYAGFVIVLLSALVLAPNPAFIVASLLVLALFYPSSAPPQGILEHQAHP